MSDPDYGFGSLFVVSYPGPHHPLSYDDRVYTNRREAEKVASYARRATAFDMRPYRNAQVQSLDDFLSDVQSEALDATRGDHCW